MFQGFELVRNYFVGSLSVCYVFLKSIKSVEDVDGMVVHLVLNNIVDGIVEPLLVILNCSSIVAKQEGKVGVGEQIVHIVLEGFLKVLHIWKVARW